MIFWDVSFADASLFLFDQYLRERLYMQRAGMIIFAEIQNLMVVFPHAKINIGLYIIAKRHDGYHNLESILYPVPWKDILEMIPAPDGQFHFSQSGSGPDTPKEENLVVKTWQLIKKRYDLPEVHIHLHKNIPFGAGLGGGSSDAAHTILAAEELFKLRISIKRKQRLAGKLGSDCPFFIDGKAHFVAGTGDLLAESRLDLSGFHIGIVKPQVSINTAEAYRRIEPAPAPVRWEAPGNDPANWKGKVRNQFEDYVLPQYPEIAQIKDQLYHLGAVFASLSGSGSAVYGLFREAPDMDSWFAGQTTWQGQL